MAEKPLSSHSDVFASQISSNESPLVDHNGGDKIASILSLDQTLASITLSVF